MTIFDRIIEEINRRGEIAGTEFFAELIGNVNSKPWLIKNLRMLDASGMIEIVHSRGGRGKKTVYRRNRNSPGYPRSRNHS